MTRVRAIYVIGESTDEVVPSGRIDGDGRVLYRRRNLVRAPGTVFEVDDEKKLRQMLETGSIEILDEGYDDLIAEAAEVLYVERNGPRPKPAVPEVIRDHRRYPHERNAVELSPTHRALTTDDLL